MTTATESLCLRRTTANNVRVEIVDGIVTVGLEIYNRKPLTNDQAFVFAGAIGLCDSTETPKVIKLARTCETPVEIWKRLGPPVD